MFDVLSVFPYDLCLNNGYDGIKNSKSHLAGYFKFKLCLSDRITRLPRMYRLVKLARMGKMVKKIKKKEMSEIIEDMLQINSSVMR